MNLFGISIKKSEIQSVTFERNGATITASAGGPNSPPVKGFSRNVVPLTPGRMSKGGQNPANMITARPPAPGGSGGAT